MKRLLLFLSVVGPGLVTASADNDAGGITTYSLAGARFGYDLLWTLPPITVALIVVQEMVARMGAATGAGLADLIRERYGAPVTVYALLALVVANIGVTVSEFAGIAAALEIYGLPRYVSVPAGAALVWWLVVAGSHRVVERVFLAASLFYVVYAVAAVLVQPGWGGVVHALLVPPPRADLPYLLMAIGVVGTTITPWMQFYLQAAVVEKGIGPQTYRLARWEVVLGCVVTNLVSLFIIVTCAATLHAEGIAVADARDAALALRPVAGRYAADLFAAGLLNASLLGASILPLATAFYVCEGLGWEAGVGKRWREAPQFYGLFTAVLVLSAALVLLPGVPLLAILFYPQVLNGLLLPLLLVLIVRIADDPEVMGRYANGPWQRAVAWATVAGVSALALAAAVSSLLD
ncbi:MAG TPA: divalent metal cation transporter [Thermodesulfobacteriota bacterium]|nr:divalent metal cation transporter [Thermodesulfobacteriota bacterium]